VGISVVERQQRVRLTSLRKAPVDFAHGSPSTASFLVGTDWCSACRCDAHQRQPAARLVTADEISVVADAGVGRESADAGTAGSAVQGLAVNGTPVDPASSPT